MRRCFDLARLGAQTASPNPLVGAVIVHQDRIIGEGYHHARGEAHAEVNAISSVSGSDKMKIPESTIYVSLEPCCHHGLTPPCTDLILSNGIKNVVISCVDPNPAVSGTGVERLRAQGVSVMTDVLKAEGRYLLSGFRSAMTRQRPYVIIKFAQSRDRYIGHPDHQVWLSNASEKVLVHKLRSEVDGIIVGTNTVMVDNPMLNNREYFGESPVRITFDRQNRIPKDFHILDGSVKTLVYTELDIKREDARVYAEAVRDQKALQNTNGDSDISQDSNSRRNSNPEYIQMAFDESLLHNCLIDLGSRNIQSVLVEGGASLVNSFVKHELWDEAWVITTQAELKRGVKAPLLHGNLIQKLHFEGDEAQVIRRFY